MLSLGRRIGWLCLEGFSLQEFCTRFFFGLSVARCAGIKGYIIRVGGNIGPGLTQWFLFGYELFFGYISREDGKAFLYPS